MATLEEEVGATTTETPAHECVTIYFLKDLVRGQKKFLHCDRVKYLSVPQYKGLGIR